VTLNSPLELALIASSIVREAGAARAENLGLFEKATRMECSLV